MSIEWIKFEKATLDKPEIWAIASELDIDPDAVIGKLLRVWAWFDEHTDNGNAPSVTKKLLNAKVNEVNFCETVINSGWMCEKDGFIWLPNFDRHNGVTAKRRALSTRRVQKHREEKPPETCNAEEVTKSLPEKEKKKNKYNSDFEVFWKNLPCDFGSHGNKKPAFEKFKVADPPIQDGKTKGEFLLEVYRQQSEAKSIQKRNGAFVENFQHIERWIHNQAWESEIPQNVRRLEF